MSVLLLLIFSFYNFNNSLGLNFNTKIFEDSETFRFLHDFDDYEKILVEKSNWNKNGVSLVKRSNLGEDHTIMISCRRKNMEKLEAILLEMSDLKNEKSQKRMSHQEVQQFTYSPESIMYVLQYLRKQNISIDKDKFLGNVITATASIRKWSSIFNTEFNQYSIYNPNLKSNITINRAIDYSLPKHLEPHIDYIHHLIHFPSIAKMGISQVTPTYYTYQSPIPSISMSLQLFWQ